ncbi:MAG TPA: ABC transporter ATP-binding protein [Methylococcus sp.]|nr:ABC transporter ATP-binding protein [Methylococcus sp.]
MTARVEVVHSLPGRVRLRIARKRRDAAYLRRLADQLAGLEGITAVRVNPDVGSILITHDFGANWEPIRRFLCQQELLEISSPRYAPSLGEATNAGFRVLDRRLRHATGGALDARSALFVTFLALTVQQILRGEILGPATTLLFQGLSFLKDSR